jgi:16S rRNA (cytosine1402-N4)-methyltransferase
VFFRLRRIEKRCCFGKNSEAREVQPIKTTDELKEVLAKYLPERVRNKILAQIYQAIRIEVNQEMDVLKEFLSSH